ncbi:hypothetical protein ABPG72_019468 [Tetrahymena utriculariae]
MSKIKADKARKQEEGLKKKLNDCLEQFYEQQAYCIVNGFLRSKVLSYILLVTKNAQFLLLFLSRSNLSKLVKKDYNFSFLFGWNFIADFIDGKNQAQKILFLPFILNFLMVFSLIAQIGLFIKHNLNELKIASFAEQCKQNYEQLKKQKSQRIIFIREALSFFHLTYEYLFCIPSAFASVVSQSQFISYIITLITIRHCKSKMVK